MSRRTGRRADEVGAYLVLYALLGVAFFTMAAIVLDIAGVKQARRSDRAAADLAATAGAASIDTSDSTTYAVACADAWGYVLANRGDSGGSITAPDCAGTFPSTEACNGFLGARTAVGFVNDARIEITSPVPDASDLMAAENQGGDRPQAIVAAKDGNPCERLAVRVVRTHHYLFGQVAGSTGTTTDIHSVARALTTTSTSEAPAVVALERAGCDALVAAGGTGRLRLGGGASGQAGLALVDSDGSGCGAGYTIDAADSNSIVAQPSGAAAGVLASVAAGGSNFARAFDPADVSSGQLSPTPLPAAGRTGRSMIDLRYGTAIAALRAEFAGGPPGGFSVYAGPCVVPADPVPVVLAGDTYVDCPGGFDVSGSVTFTGGTVAFRGGIIVRAGGCLAVGDTACGAVGVPLADAAVYAGGSLAKEEDGGVHLSQTVVVADGGFDVPVDQPPPAGALVWTAPVGGAFEDLLGATETSADVRLGEQPTTTLEGTLFAPNATVALSARPGAGIDQPLQVVANRVRLDGDGDVTLAPVPSRATGRLTRQVRLIR